MPFIWGRLVGAAVGLLAGPFGVALGFLVGFLLDQLVREMRNRQRLESFLRNPLKSPPRGVPRVVVAIVGLSVWLAHTSGFLRNRHVESLRTFLRTQYDIARKSEAAIGRVVDEAIRQVDLIDRRGLAMVLRGHLADRADPIYTSAIADHFSSLVTDDTGAVSPDHARRLVLLSDFLGVPLLAERAARGRLLDPLACEILGIPRTADRDEVKRVFRQLAAHFHPDRLGELSEQQRIESTAAFIRIRAAYDRAMEQLSDSAGGDQ